MRSSSAVPAIGHDFSRISILPPDPETVSKREAELSELKLQRSTEGVARSSPVPAWGHDFSKVSVLPVQRKLTVGQPNDPYEQEADRVAEQVMSMPDSATQQPIQRETAPEEEELQTKPLAASITPLVQREAMPEEEEIQTKASENSDIQREDNLEEEDLQTKPSLQRATDGSLQAGGNLESRLNSSKGGGSPLPQDVKGFMESRFRTDFSQVRVHTDSEAVQMNQDLNAQAFTHKQDVYFGAGKTPGKDALTAHELTHVVQQTGAVQTKDISKQLTVQPKCLACESEEVGVQRSLNLSPVLESIQRREVCDDEGVCRSEPDPVESSSSNVVTLPEVVIEGEPQSSNTNTGAGGAPGYEYRDQRGLGAEGAPSAYEVPNPTPAISSPPPGFAWHVREAVAEGLANDCWCTWYAIRKPSSGGEISDPYTPQPELPAPARTMASARNDGVCDCPHPDGAGLIHRW
ncbi:DUF4157 domain-containing protein [Cyanobacteria bacterium FACHB-63]|nr:DUF4157 domain-containing protein [Cyanobacteria bacterium FACHB-63]